MSYETVGVCMAYDERGNAYDCFDDTIEHLEWRAKRHRGLLTLDNGSVFVRSISSSLACEGFPAAPPPGRTEEQA